MSRAEQWKFQLVGDCNWQVRVVCGGGGSSQSSVTEDESSYGKAEFPLQLEISVCKAPGFPHLPKHIGEHLRLVTFSPSFTLKMIHERVGVFWHTSTLQCEPERESKQIILYCFMTFFFLVFCIVESPVYSLVNRQHDYMLLLCSNHTREGGQQRCEYRACTTAHMLRLSKVVFLRASAWATNY